MLPGKNYAPADYVAMLTRRFWIIGISMFLCGYAALIVSSFLHDTYRSEMLIQVVPQRVPDSYVRSTVTMETSDRFTALSQQVMSRTELERLIKDMNLYPDERAKLPMQDVVEKMRKNINVEVASSRNTRDKAPDAFYVRFSYADAQIATKVTEKLGALFIDMNAQDRGDLAQATNNFLQSQLAETRRKLEEQEQKLEAFRQKNVGRLPSQMDFNMQTIQRRQLEVQAVVESLARDRDRKLMLERLHNEAQAELLAPPAVPVVAVATDGKAANVPLTPAQELAVARDGLSKLQERLKPEHPDIGRIKRRIADLEAKVAEQPAADPADPAAANAAAGTPDQTARRERLRQMRADIESLDRQIAFKETEEQRLRGIIADLQRRIEDVPGLESEWTALTRDYDTLRASYRDLLTKSEESQVAAELEKRQIGEQFRILDPARLPDRPSGLRKLQVNGIGLGIGLGLGLLLAGLLELTPSIYRTPSDVQDVLKLPVVAVVPYLATAIDRRRRRRQRTMALSAATASIVVAGYVFWAMSLWKHVV